MVRATVVAGSHGGERAAALERTRHREPDPRRRRRAKRQKVLRFSSFWVALTRNSCLPFRIKNLSVLSQSLKSLRSALPRAPPRLGRCGVADRGQVGVALKVANEVQSDALCPWAT